MERIIAAEELSAIKIEVELRYVYAPGHAGIQGNLKADRAARRGASHVIRKQEAGRLMIECVSWRKHDISGFHRCLQADMFNEAKTLF